MTLQQNAHELAVADAWRRYREAVQSGKPADLIMMRLRAALALESKENS